MSNDAVDFAAVAKAIDFAASELRRAERQTQALRSETQRLRTIVRLANDMMGSMQGPADLPVARKWEALEIALADLAAAEELDE